MKMAKIEDRQKAECVLWYQESNSALVACRKFRNKYGKSNVPSKSSVRRWHAMFKDSGHVSSIEKHERRKPYQENEVLKTLEKLFKSKPITSVRTAAQHVPVSKTTVHKILRKHMKKNHTKFNLFKLWIPGTMERERVLPQLFWSGWLMMPDI